MHLVRWPGEQPPLDRSSVATLGVFDGVHRGHAEVILRVVSAARQRSCQAAIATFDRHPAAVLRGTAQPAITSLEHRIRLFEGFGVDLCVVMRFSEEMANMPAEEFLRQVACGLMRAELLVLGSDCRFGRNREGDVGLCTRIGQQLGFEVLAVAPVEVDGERVSSTAIREAVLKGELERAGRLLGRPFSLYGTVVHSDGRGRELGYPTANLDLHNETIPPDGVYAAWAFTDSEPLPSVVSVGFRATFRFEPDGTRAVEVHLLDYEADLYGCDIEIEFVLPLRAQIAFGNAGSLAAQIGRDVEEARRVLQARPRRL
ncbi:MAG: riboflavin biosynthesis protein RibF [Planctomycetota bacterium]|jgi:riboflavin kinase/FMN adenylyltransferase